MPPKSTLSDSERFWLKVDKNGPMPEKGTERGPCWLWTDHKLQTGYGSMKIGGTRRHVYSHRFAWEDVTGQTIPPGFDAAHWCNNKACVHVDPDPSKSHIWPVEHAVNVRQARDDRLIELGDSHHTRRMPETVVRGASHPNARLSDDIVVDMRRRHALGESVCSIARSYGVVHTLAYKAIHRLTWKRVA